MAEPRDPGRPRRFTPVRRTTIVGLVLAILALAAAHALFELPVPRRLPSLAETRRANQAEVLESYAGRESQGALLPPNDVVLAIPESFLQQVLAASVPVHQSFEDGRYIARLDSTHVQFEDGLAVVTLSGRGMLSSDPDSPLYADLLLQGLLTISGVDPDSGTLEPSIVITNMRVRRAGPPHLRGVLHPVARYFGRLKVEDWNRLGQEIRIPVRIDREFVLPAIRGDVSLPESRVPVSVRVSAVTTLERRMAVSLALLPDTTGGFREPTPERPWDDEALAAGVPRRGLFRRAASEETIAALRSRVRALARRDTLWRAVTASDHDVVAVVPLRVLETLTHRVGRRYLRGVVVDFRPEVRARVDEELRVKVLGRSIGAGRVGVNVRVHHLRGRLTSTGPPLLRLVPPSELTVTQPMRVLSGRGVSTFHMTWDPAKLVSIVCRSFAAHRTLVGEIEPLREDLTTRIRFTVQGSAIVGRPRVDRERIRMAVDLTPASWARVRSVLVEQDRFGRCGLVMNADSVLGKLRGLAGRGVEFRLPARMFKPFDLPVALVTTRSTGNYRIEAVAYDPEIVVQKPYLRIAFRAHVRVGATPDTSVAQGEGQIPTASSSMPASPAKPVSP